MQNTKHSQMCPNWGTSPYSLQIVLFFLIISARLLPSCLATVPDDDAALNCSQAIADCLCE